MNSDPQAPPGPPPILTPAGDEALRACLACGALVAFDFDGTLAPIVDVPGDARIPDAIARRLRRLARRLPVAVVTGRSVVDVRGRLGFEPAHVVGSHGAEDPAAPAAASLARALDACRLRLRAFDARLRVAGVRVEDKGMSIALHYRGAPDPRAAAALIDEVAAGAGDGVRWFGGKLVRNVVAAAAGDKGDALEALVARAGVRNAVFVGDDANDEPVFERGRGRWLTVRVGGDGRSRAGFRLEGIEEVPELLDRMLRACPLG